jgi:4-nitrophenol 2-monooxygenase / 4-nitrocatechol 4-monooxygenase, reductase component
MSTTTDESRESDVRVIDQDSFRDVIGRFASGVTIITTSTDDTDFGTTASAVSSLSMDPPMLLICLNKTSDTQAAILASRRFGVNILHADQGQIAYQFAKKGGTKFDGVSTVRGVSGVPLVKDALAHVECEVTETVTGGTHVVFLARVIDAAGNDGEPLTYFRGRFGRLESAHDEVTYRELREQVIQRRLPVGQPLDLEQIAEELSADAARVHYALTKLSSDGLVTRQTPNSYVVSPLTAHAAEQLFDARCSVEIAVADRTVGRAGDEELAELQDLADALAAIVKSDAPDLTAFLATSHTFHARLVGFARCEPLSELYDRLGIPAFWTQAVGGQAWWNEFDVVHHARLAQAYQAADVQQVKHLIYDHAEQVKRLARELIAAAGGEV